MGVFLIAFGVLLLIGLLFWVPRAVHRSIARGVAEGYRRGEDESAAGSVPPGWQTDPDDSDFWRYWDGGRWTEQRAQKGGGRT